MSEVRFSLNGQFSGRPKQVQGNLLLIIHGLYLQVQPTAPPAIPRHFWRPTPLTPAFYVWKHCESREP